jgi:hypothetical protein
MISTVVFGRKDIITCLKMPPPVILRRATKEHQLGWLPFILLKQALNVNVDMMVSIFKWPAFQAKGDATGPPRKSESKVGGSSVKRAEEKKRHERRLSATVSAKQEASDKEEKREREADVGQGFS